MSFDIEQLLAHRSEIDAELRHHKSPVTVMFTDLAGSTNYFERFGDTAGMTWIEEHYHLVIPHIQEHGGTVVKTIGDSVMAYFTDPAQAVQAAVGIQQGVEGGNPGRTPLEQMHVRVALHHGLAYLRGVDVFGDVVNVAARITKSCLPAQILVSEALYLSAQQGTTNPFRPVGTVQFRGKSASEKLYEIIWTDDESYDKLRQQFPARESPKSCPEDLSAGRYIIMNEIGRGAMGVVYKAYDRVIGRMVALKTIPLEVDECERAALVNRLKQEARAAGGLDHPNIVTVYDVGEEAGMFYLTMQYVEGRTLSAIRSEKELMPVDQVLDIAQQLCSALAFAHKAGIVHRDIKPSNLMMTANGSLKILDFGIAKLGDAGLTKADVIVGTPSYLAPEQAAGRRVDHRSDIFALGAVLYELLTAEKAFPGESTTSIIYKILNEDPIPPRAIEPAISPRLDAVVRTALAKDPSQRFQSCDEMLEALNECRSGASAGAKLPKRAAAQATLQKTRTLNRTPQYTLLTAELEEENKHRFLPWAIGAAALILVAGGFWWFHRASRKAQVPPPVAVLPSNLSPVPPAAAPVTSPSGTPTTPASEPTVTPPPTEAQPETGAAESETVPAEEAASASKAESLERKEKAADKAPELTAPVRKRGRTRASKELERLDAEETDSSGMFTRRDIPAMLSKADGFYGQGDYKSAIIYYQQVLRLDAHNQAARDGLRRAQELQQTKR